MADRALITERAVMGIILGVAGGAVHGRAFKDAVDMALLTGNSGMFPIQFERKLGMVYLCQFPSIGGVTCCAFRSELTVVMVVFQMAGDAGLGSGLQVIHRPRSNMALGAGDGRMLAAQFERNRVVVKVRAE